LVCMFDKPKSSIEQLLKQELPEDAKAIIA